MTETPHSNSSSPVADPAAKPEKLTLVVRNLLSVAAGFVALAAGGGYIYSEISEGNGVPMFAIPLVMTVPVIAAVAFRVLLDAWKPMKDEPRPTSRPGR
ncbi:hypothetical protein [Paraburkholderia sp.]|uniref:hypothetical protein n=1 Tax=Paraburkholderia sp. TaxID=1926495 RepID=UPI0023A3A280|nr:hypothetical protein [Paraburkholderia sp.]MDE1179866.1 hypothetical protein [Paraburkholderia sp.]